MGLTVTPIEQEVVGTKRQVVADIQFDSSYPTGGESLVPADVGLGVRIDTVLVESNAGRGIQYDQAARKLKLLDAAGAEVANASNQSAVTVRATILGV